MTQPVNSVDPQLVYEYSAGNIQVDSIGLQRRIDAVLSALRSYCHWMPFPVREETFVLNGYRQVPLVLPTLRVSDLTEVKANGKVVPLDQIEWGHNGVVYLHSSAEWVNLRDPHPVPWPKRLRGIEVKASHGFSFEECADLIGTVASTVGRTTFNPLGRTGYKVGERQENFAVGSGGLVTGTRPLGDDLAVWDAYVLPDRSWEGG
ncbi:head-to-tail adaptor [Gordonia phage Archimedes]|uniref:Head-to-tail adaptor n=1 Tax=Gordonia phage Archimedes TaxID=2759389 RepID=A0A7L7SHJ4_9CAUD|nr:head-to-tail adaptor [Gordonia phage Archimedes]QOC55706.1 head-to-tail adaptor [Gordonia phage Archimedes]